MSAKRPFGQKRGTCHQVRVALVLGIAAGSLLLNLSIARAGEPPPKPPTSLTDEGKPGRNTHMEGWATNSQETNASVSAAPAIRSTYVSRVSHEVNTPEPLPAALLAPEPLSHDGPNPYPPQYAEPAPMEDLWEFPRVFRPDQYERYRGEGDPLVGASWLNRPYYAGFILGAWYGDTLIPGEVDQGIGFLYGARLGWDYDTYWGMEMRLAFSEVGLEFIDEPSVDGLSTDVVVWDGSLIYYPWGDARWRPYVGAGIGLVDFDFLTATGIRRSEAVVGLPLSAGLKYRQTDWITMRFDVTDNIAFGGRAGFETMNNLSLSGGLEFRFGGTRKSYFPWNPSRTLR